MLLEVGVVITLGELVMGREPKRSVFNADNVFLSLAASYTDLFRKFIDLHAEDICIFWNIYYTFLNRKNTLYIILGFFLVGRVAR